MQQPLLFPQDRLQTLEELFPQDVSDPFSFRLRRLSEMFGTDLPSTAALCFELVWQLQMRQCMRVSRLQSRIELHPLSCQWGPPEYWRPVEINIEIDR